MRDYHLGLFSLLLAHSWFGTVSAQTTETSTSSTSEGNGVVSPGTTLPPAPTFITTHENEFVLKMTYFVIALILFTVPACFACIFCFQRHQKRLKAVRSLQEAKRKGVKEKEGGGNLAEGTGGTSALNISLQSPSSPASPGGKKGGFTGAAPLNESAHPNAAGGGAPPAPGVFTIYDMSHTPPDQSLVPQNELFDKAPFHEDGAVLPDEIINGGGGAGKKGGAIGGFGEAGDDDESLGLLGGGKSAGGFGKSKNLMADDTNVREQDGFGASTEAAGFSKSKSSGGFKAFGNSIAEGDDEENPLEPHGEAAFNESAQMDESREMKGWGKNKGGRKAEW